jgi:S1-C subfamily serine protease
MLQGSLQSSLRLIAVLVAVLAWGLCSLPGSAGAAEPEGRAAALKNLRGRPLGKEAGVVVAPGRLIDALRRPVRDDWPPRTFDERPRGWQADVYDSRAESVVVIRTETGHGTGFLIDPDGWILTNHHVVADAPVDPDTGAQTVMVHVGRFDDDRVMQLDERPTPALVHKDDAVKDLALVKLTGRPADGKPLAAIPLAAKRPRAGDECLAIGHPAAGLFWTLKTGTVSTVGRWPHDAIDVVMLRLAATEAADRDAIRQFLRESPPVQVVLSECGLNPGDSGGPLLNQSGELIAVTYAIPRTDEDDPSTAGISLDKHAYHVHLDEVRTFVKDRPKEALVFVPEAWPAGQLAARIDSDADGYAETLVVGQDVTATPTGMLIDLDGDSRAKAGDSETPAAAADWDFELALHFVPQVRIFYDTDNDGAVDRVLTDSNDDGNADGVLTLQGKEWRYARGRDGQAAFDLTLFRDEPLGRRAAELLATP